MPYHNSSKNNKTTSKKPVKKKNVGKKTPKVFNRMPNGSFMKRAKHPTKKK